MPKLVLVLQYWDGDREAIFRNARRIADIESKPRTDVGICFAYRFDATPPSKEILDYVGQKFSTMEVYRSIRRATGWPYGCNELAHAIFQESARRVKEGEWKDVEAIFLMESDCIPITKDWINSLLREWEETKKEGKSLFGSWLPYHGSGGDGHINGNAVFKSTIALDVDLSGCPADHGWDSAHANKLVPICRKSGLIKNLYLGKEISNEDIEAEWTPGVKPVLIHGVKDRSVEKYTDKYILGRDPVNIQTP